MTWISQRKQSLLVVSLLLLAASTAVSQPADRSNNQQANRPLQLLVLGDSILWGQGLKTEHKTWHHIKVWLQESTGRSVVERIEAHSGE